MRHTLAIASLLALAAFFVSAPVRAEEAPDTPTEPPDSLFAGTLWQPSPAPPVLGGMLFPRGPVGQPAGSLFAWEERTGATPPLNLPPSARARSFFAGSGSEVLLPAAGPARTVPPPLSPGGKFKLAMKRTFYPVPVVAAAAGAGWAMLIDSESDEGFGMGADGFARRFLFRVAFNGTKQVVGTFALASALKQDPRYLPSRKRDLWPRVWYALTRTVVTRSDAGEPQFNAPLVLGTAAAAGASIGYVRDQDSSGAEAARRFGLSLALSAAKNVFREFFTRGD